MNIGRNDPCSCGSGKKYKRCCLIRQELDAQAQAAIEEAEFQEWLAKDLVIGQQNLRDAELIRQAIPRTEELI